MIKTFETILNFGKHKGKTIDEVFGIAPQYLEWCLDNMEDRDFEMSNKDVFIIKQKSKIFKDDLRIEHEALYGDATEVDIY